MVKILALDDFLCLLQENMRILLNEKENLILVKDNQILDLQNKLVIAEADRTAYLELDTSPSLDIVNDDNGELKAGIITHCYFIDYFYFVFHMILEDFFL